MAETQTHLLIPRWTHVYQDCARRAGYQVSDISTDDNGDLISEWTGNVRAVRKTDFVTGTMRGKLERIQPGCCVAVGHCYPAYPINARAWRATKGGYRIIVNYGGKPVKLAMSRGVEVATNGDGETLYHGKSQALVRAGIKHHPLTVKLTHRRTCDQYGVVREKTSTLLPDGSILHRVESEASQRSRLIDYAAFRPDWALEELRKDPSHQRFMACVLPNGGNNV